MTFAFFLACQQSLVAQQQALWGLHTGNQFTVETTVERATTLQIDGGAQITTNVKELIELVYTVNNVRPTGIVFEIRIAKAIRLGKSGREASDNTADQQLESLKAFSAFILVAPNGVVTNISRRFDSLRQLADSDPLSLDLLSGICTDNVMTSWFGYPFWMSAPEDKRQEAAEWQQLDELSLGLMGSCRTIVTCTIESVEDQQLGVKIAGTSRHIPYLAAANDSSTLLKFNNVEATVERFEGSGKMIVPKPAAGKPTEDDRNELRPWFENLTLEWLITGKATVAATAQEKVLTFRQTRKQTSRLLPDYSVGQRRLVPTDELFMNRPR